MRKIAFTYVLSWGLGFFLMPTAYAETNSTDQSSEYRIPTYDRMEFSAEQSGSNRVSMKWTPFDGFNNEKFQYYKVIRSYSNPNPIYPEEEAIGAKQAIGDLRFTDEKAERSAYYRVCTITDVKGRHCSNAVWIELEKMNSQPKCNNLSSTGECEDYKKEAELKEKARKEWNEKQEAAKERLEKKKVEKEAQEKKVKEYEKPEHEDDRKNAHEAHQEELYKKLYVKLDAWLENFEARLEQSSLTSVQKVERIEAIQKRFYEWEQGKSVRIKMVDYIDKTLNEWKQKYSAADDFSEIDDFLNGLLDS
jgi:hypothetical protein